MRSWKRDTWLAIGLLALLVIITVAAAITQTRRQEQPALASFSNAPEGARALRLWLDSLGYTTRDDIGSGFAIPAGTSLFFLLEPQDLVGDQEWRSIDRWVESGGTLVLAGQGIGTLLAAGHYDFRLLPLVEEAETLRLETPLLASPPLAVSRLSNLSARARLESDRADYTAHLSGPEGPVLVSFEKGAGRVLICACAYPFSNRGLKDAGNPELVLNLVAAVRLQAGSPAGRFTGQVLFDEWHHGVRPQAQEVVGPGQWLRRTPAGQALLLAAVVALVAVVLHGRNFGRPVPPPVESNRRAPLEYITAIANLNRRAGHRAAVMQQVHRRLKRDLGQRYRLNPTLPDEEYVAQLARLRPDTDAEALLSLLSRMSRPGIHETEMVQLAREAAEWMKTN